MLNFDYLMSHLSGNIATHASHHAKLSNHEVMMVVSYSCLVAWNINCKNIYSTVQRNNLIPGAPRCHSTILTYVVSGT